MALSDMKGRRASSRPSTGEMQTMSVSAMMVLLDDLEITGELPVGDGLAGLAFFPFARCGVMVNEGVPEKRARGLRRFEPLGRFAQGTRQGPLLGVLDGVSIA